MLAAQKVIQATSAGEAHVPRSAPAPAAFRGEKPRKRKLFPALVCGAASAVCISLPPAIWLRQGYAAPSSVFSAGLLLLGGSMLCALFGRSRPGRAAAFAALAASAGLLAYDLVRSRGISEDFFADIETGGIAAIYIAAAYSIHLLSRNDRCFRHSMAATLTGLITFAFGVSLLIGRTFARTNIRDPSVLSSMVPFGALFLGVALISLADVRKGRIPSSFADLRRSILIFSGVAVFTITLLMGGLAGLAVSRHVRLGAEQALIEMTREKGRVLGRTLEDLQSQLEVLYRAAHALGVFPRDWLGRRGSFTLTGFAVFDEAGKVVMQAGVAEPLLEASLPWHPRHMAAEPITIGGKPFLIAGHLFRAEGGHGARVKLAGLIEMPSARITMFESRFAADTYLAWTGDDRAFWGGGRRISVYRVSPGGGGAITPDAALDTALRRRSGQGFMRQAPAPLPREDAVAYAPLPSTNLVVLNALAARRLYSSADRLLVDFLAAALLVALLGTAVVYAVIGDLTYHSDELHARLEEQRGELARELRERQAMEQVLRRSEEQAKESAYEKELLLHEVHHRVKNNLQTISSLLSLQAKRFQNDDVRKALQDSRNRVRSIALLHEMLYQAGDLTYIDFQGYLQKIGEKLLAVYEIGQRVSIRLDVEPVPITLDVAIPCGLIVNELMTNALKHAFPDDRHGSVVVRFKRVQGTMLLAVADDGVGDRGRMNFAAGGALGGRLIRSLVRQLDGSVSAEECARGTEIRILFHARELNHADGTGAGVGADSHR